jgi:hypothetical protein
MSRRTLPVRTAATACAPAIFALALWTTPSGCRQCDNPCPPQYNVLQFCAATGLCAVDGTAIKDCVGDGGTPNCVLWNPPPGAALTIPVGAMWSSLGSRDDLSIGCNCTLSAGPDSGQDGSASSTVTVLFDGSPGTGCGTPPLGPITCENVPRSVNTITLSLTAGASNLGLYFEDHECQAVHPLCPL